MKPHKYLPLVAIIAMLSFSCSTEELAEDNYDLMALPQAPASKQIEIEIMELINEYRIEKGLEVLKSDNLVKSVAFTHTDYMVETNDVSHQNFYQRKVLLERHAAAKEVSENVGYGYSTARTVVDAWIASEPHHVQLVGDYTDFEVSAEQNEQGRWFYTNMFIKR